MKINRLNIADELIKNQFNMIGKTFQDAVHNPEWIHEWSMTQAQYDEFKTNAVALIKKVFKCNKTKAEQNFSWFSLQFGLKIVD